MKITRAVTPHAYLLTEDFDQAISPKFLTKINDDIAYLENFPGTIITDVSTNQSLVHNTGFLAGKVAKHRHVYLYIIESDGYHYCLPMRYHTDTVTRQEVLRLLQTHPGVDAYSLLHNYAAAKFAQQ